MSRYLPMVRTSTPEALTGLQPGQWINYDGSLGRFMGLTPASIWIAWEGTARKRFATFAAAFNKNERSRKSAG
jgi:hypothetical protein